MGIPLWYFFSFWESDFIMDGVFPGGKFGKLTKY
jgi:hypothetical protein